MLIISCSVFFANSSVNLQALVVFIVILAAYILQQTFKPFTLHQLNQMESKSIIVSAVTIYSGMFFLTNSLNDDLKLCFFSLMVLSNLAFLSYWIYYTFGYYLGKLYLNLNCCQRLFGNRMKNWVSKVVPIIEEEKIDTTFDGISVLTREKKLSNLKKISLDSN